MSKGPGRIQREIARSARRRVARPRDRGGRDHASFMQIKREIWELIRAEIVRQ